MLLRVAGVLIRVSGTLIGELSHADTLHPTMTILSCAIFFCKPANYDRRTVPHFDLYWCERLYGRDLDRWVWEA